MNKSNYINLFDILNNGQRVALVTNLNKEDDKSGYVAEKKVICHSKFDTIDDNLKTLLYNS